MSDLAGAIQVTLLHDAKAVQDVSIRSSRPQLAQAMFQGKPIHEVVDLIGLVFSLCGKAQKWAAAASGAAATGEALSGEMNKTHEQAVLTEMMLEHAWRLLLDWPQLNALTPDMEAMVALRSHANEPSAFVTTLNQALNRALGVSTVDWLAMDWNALSEWLKSEAYLAQLFSIAIEQDAVFNATDDALLPMVKNWQSSELVTLGKLALSKENFCAQPDWHQQPAQTSAYARVQTHERLLQWVQHHGMGIGARMMARLVELAEVASHGLKARQPLMQSHRIDVFTGIALVETSRGVLAHVVKLDNDSTIEHYRIVAPTEWNFHSKGALVKTLKCLLPSADLKAKAKQVCQAFDPCVAFNVEVQHA